MRDDVSHFVVYVPALAQLNFDFQMDDNAWDDLCVNPHDGAHNHGREEGHLAGMQKGFDDGQRLGNTKGMEFGMELGFLNGVVSEIELRILPTVCPEKKERATKSLKELRRMILSFPDPDELFQVNPEGRLDLSLRMQGIRAKYKVLTVQLHIPQVTLKDVLNEQLPSAVSSEW